MMSFYESRMGEKYFTPEQQEALDQFIKDGPVVGMIYDNGSEKRHVVRIELPVGAITEDTVFGEAPKGGLQPYHTPTAKGQPRFAIVSHKVGDEWGQCNSVEWLKWLGGDFKVDEVPDTPESEGQKKARAAVLGKAMSKEKVRVAQAVVDKNKPVKPKKDKKDE